MQNRRKNLSSPVVTMKKGYVQGFDSRFRDCRHSGEFVGLESRSYAAEMMKRPRSCGPLVGGGNKNEGFEIDRHVQDLTKRFQAIKFQLAFLESRGIVQSVSDVRIVYA